MSDKQYIIQFVGQDDVSNVAGTIQQNIGAIEQGATKASGGISALAGIAQGAFMNIGGELVNIAKQGLQSFVGVITDGIAEASEWQSAMAQTEAVVKSTGGAAGLTAQQMGDLAGQLSAVTGASVFSDDAILGAENVLATFTQISGQNFSGATSAILDVSQALGQDLQGTAIQVGKALNDPVKGITALTRVGVTFSDEQQAVIKSLAETGNVAGAQRVILDELAKEFGGSAAAAAGTFAGKQAQLNEQFNNIKQSLGEAVMPLLGMLLTNVQMLIPYLEQGAAGFGAFLGSIDGAQVGAAFGIITSAIDTVIANIDNIKAAGSAVVAYLAPIGESLGIALQAAVPVLTTIGVLIMQAFQSTAMQSFLTAVQEVAITAFDLIAFGLTTLSTAWQDNQNIILPILATLGSAIEIAMNYITGIMRVLQLLLQGDYASAWNLLQSTWTTTLTAIKTLVSTAVTQLTGYITDAVPKMLAAGGQLMDALANGISSAAGRVAAAAMTAAQNAYNAAIAWLTGSSSETTTTTTENSPPTGKRAPIYGLRSGNIGGTNSSLAGNGSTVINNYNLNASYGNMQTEGSIAQDLRAMQYLSGAL